MATTSITSTLGAGSGIDTKALIASLVTAQFETRTKQLTARSEALTAQISDAAKLKNAITGFDAALKALIGGGTLSTQPSTSNSSVLKATATSGARLAGLATTVEVKQLASAQVATGQRLSRTAAFNPGTLTIQFGSDTLDEDGAVTGFAAAGDPVAIEIGAADATLDGIAARINATGKGVTASVVADGDGGRLVLRGGTGATQAFRVTGTDAIATDPDTGAPVAATGLSLASLDVSRQAGSPTTIGSSARDAVVRLDGATFTRGSNTISNLVSGVKLELTATGTTTLGTAAPTAALSQAVSDFVATFNDVLAVVKAADDAVTGTLRSDTATDALMRGLRTLTTATIGTDTASGAPRTLSDLGVSTNNDGTLAVNATRLSAALLNHGGAVESMFAEGGGLSSALSKLATAASGTQVGFDASTKRFEEAQEKIAEQQEVLAARSTAASDRMTRQFAAMDARVAAYKSTMTFMENQIDAWTQGDD